MGGVGGVAEQDRVAVRPVRVGDGGEGEPGGLVGAQRPAAESLGEDLGAVFGGPGGVAGVEARGPPYLFAHLDDDGGGAGFTRRPEGPRRGAVVGRRAEGVGVQLHHAVLGLGDLEAEGVEREVGGEPDVAVAVVGDGGAEVTGVGLAGGAVHPVGGDDQVVAGRELCGGRRLGPEAEPYPEGRAALVQDPQERTAAQCGEAVAARGQGGAPVHDVDGVPADERVAERPVHDGVGVLDAAERLVGEDHTEAEGVVGGVALPYGDLAAGVQPLQEGGGVEPEECQYR